MRFKKQYDFMKRYIKLHVFYILRSGNLANEPEMNKYTEEMGTSSAEGWGHPA